MENKEIFTDLQYGKTITIGGFHSILLSGGHLQITQDLKAGEDRDINLFNEKKELISVTMEVLTDSNGDKNENRITSE